MPNEQKNFLGIPIEGSINMSGGIVPQDSPQLLQDKLKSLIEQPVFEALRWRQYTPYFNDGDPCKFGVNEVYFRFVGIGEEEDDDEYGDYGDGFVGLRDGRYASDENLKRILGVPGAYGSGVEWIQEPEDTNLIALADEVSRMIGSGSHYDFLYETFGDHAIVTVRKDMITVDEYEHD